MEQAIGLFKLVYMLGVEAFLEQLMPAPWLQLFWLLAGTHVGGTHYQLLFTSGYLEMGCGSRLTILLTL